MLNYKLKNKKGAAILLIVSIAFIISIIIFINLNLDKTPGPKTNYLGEVHFEIFDHYMRGEEILLYLDLAAEYSAKNSLNQEFIEDFKIEFAKKFKKYLELFNQRYANEIKNENLTIEDFEIKINGKNLILKSKKELPIYVYETRIEINGKGSEQVVQNLNYKINPSINLEIEGLDKLKLKPTIVSLR